MIAINEIVEHNGRKIKCVKEKSGCRKCTFNTGTCILMIGYKKPELFCCSAIKRPDNTDVIFIDVTGEVGE